MQQLFSSEPTNEVSETIPASCSDYQNYMFNSVYSPKRHKPKKPAISSGNIAG